MSDFGVFESAADQEASPARLAKLSANKLAAAIYDVHQAYGPFLLGSTGLDEFEDRWHYSKADIRRTVEPHLMPVTGVMRRIHDAMRKEFKQAADIGDPNAVIPNTPIQQSLAGEGALAPQPNSVTVPAAAGVAQGTPGIIQQSFRKGAPFADYKDFADCQNKNRGKVDDVDKYCGYIKHKVEDKKSHRTACKKCDGKPISQKCDKCQAKMHSSARIASLEQSLSRRDLTAALYELGGLQDAPDLDTDITFEDHQDETLIPEGDFPGYLDDVDQGGPEKVEGADFGQGGDTGSDRHASLTLDLYTDWARSNGLRVASLDTLELYASNIGEHEFAFLDSAIRAHRERRAARRFWAGEEGDDDDDPDIEINVEDDRDKDRYGNRPRPAAR